MDGMRIRPTRPDDAMALAQSCYESFTTFNKSVQIPPELDFPNLEFAQKIMQFMMSTPGIHGVVVEDESSGALMAAGLMVPGSIISISNLFSPSTQAGHFANYEGSRSLYLRLFLLQSLNLNLLETLGSELVKVCTGDVYGIGPVWADDAFKGRGAGKAVMVTLIEQAKSKNAKSIRLNQVILYIQNHFQVG